MQRATWIVVLMIISQISCATDPSSEPVEPHRAQWNKSGVSNYQFSITHFGAIQPAPPMRVGVRDGKVQNATLECGPPHSPEDCAAIKNSWTKKTGTGNLLGYARTIPQLFDDVSAARTNANKQGAKALIVFDSKYGFPQRFTFDNPKSDDEEHGFQVAQFIVLD